MAGVRPLSRGRPADRRGYAEHYTAWFPGLPPSDLPHDIVDRVLPAGGHGSDETVRIARRLGIQLRGRKFSASGHGRGVCQPKCTSWFGSPTEGLASPKRPARPNARRKLPASVFAAVVAVVWGAFGCRGRRSGSVGDLAPRFLEMDGRRLGDLEYAEVEWSFSREFGLDCLETPS